MEEQKENWNGKIFWKDRGRSTPVLNVSGPVALMLIAEESGVSCWRGSTRTHSCIYPVWQWAWGVRACPLTGDTNPNGLSQMRRSGGVAHGSPSPAVCTFFTLLPCEEAEALLRSLLAFPVPVCSSKQLWILKVLAMCTFTSVAFWCAGSSSQRPFGLGVKGSCWSWCCYINLWGRPAFLFRVVHVHTNWNNFCSQRLSFIRSKLHLFCTKHTYIMFELHWHHLMLHLWSFPCVTEKLFTIL